MREVCKGKEAGRTGGGGRDGGRRERESGVQEELQRDVIEE